MAKLTICKSGGGARPDGGQTSVVRCVCGQNGGALVVALAILAAALLVGGSLLLLGTTEADVVEYTVDNTGALWLAEAGLERAGSWLGEIYQFDSGFDPVGSEVADQPLGAGLYGFVVTDSVATPSGLPAYSVVSTGDRDGAVRQVRAVFEAESFSRYQWFIESGGGGYSWFRTGERFEGPVHVNGSIKIDGDPWFGGLVRAGGGITIMEGSNPVFERGYQLHVEPIQLPTVAEVHSTLRAAAQSGDGLYAGPLGNKAYYEVELGVPSPGYLTYTGYDEHGTPLTGGVADISLLNGAAWFDETIRIWGTLDGQLTIGVDGSIEIMDDIIYEGSTPGSGPGEDCDDVLGLIAAGHPEGDIIIRKTAANLNNCEVHAVMMAMQKNIEAEDYQEGPLRGTFTIYGSLLVDYSIHLGQYQHGVPITGYVRDYHYDFRNFVMPPPFFPLTGNFLMVSWEEVVPPVLL